jgi:hypothetical protein
VYEVPISYYGRTYEEGKKIGMMDGIAALWYIFKYNLVVSKKRAFDLAAMEEQVEAQETVGASV